MQDSASHEARTDRKAAPIVAQTVWIEESLKDAPGGVAEKPNNDHEQQRTAEWLSEDGRERAARPRYASACLGCDLLGLVEDHRRAKTLAARLGLAPPETNIVLTELPAQALLELATRDVLALTPDGSRIRLVTHRGIDDDDVTHAAAAMLSIGRPSG